MQGEGGSTSVRWVSSLLIMQSVMKGHKEAGEKEHFYAPGFSAFFLFKTFQHLSNLTCIVRAFLQKLQK